MNIRGNAFNHTLLNTLEINQKKEITLSKYVYCKTDENLCIMNT